MSSSVFFASKRILPWVGVGTLFGVFGSQLARDLWFSTDFPKDGQPKPTRSVQTDTTASPHYPEGESLPSLSNVVIRGSFTTSLNYRTKTPDWVAEMLTAELVNGKNGDRKHSQFKKDDDVPEKFRARNTDYWDSGWSRGHLAASASHRHSQDGQDSTFLLNSNIVPQDMSMNGCDWNRLEVLVRDVTKAYPSGKVYVLSGPVWVPESNTPFTQRPFSKNRVIMHEVVGETAVHVPTHMFKIIRLRDSQNHIDASVAFIMPNRPLPTEQPVESFRASLEELERDTGLDLSGMKASKDLCTIVKCGKPTNRRMLGWRHYGRIDEARDLNELRSAVCNAVDDGFVDGDNFLIPKAVKDRMNDLGIGEHVELLFPDNTKYRESVKRGIEVFKKRSSQSPIDDS
jgi:DNA/RNA endonuclease G (NUC1)